MRNSQPKLSIDNKQILKTFETQLAIPNGALASAAIIVAIGDEYTSRSNKSSFIPIVIAQQRTDLSSSSPESSKANAFFRGWDGYSSLVRHTENVTPEMMKQHGFALGMEIQGINLEVNVGFTPSYDGQDPILNPETGRVVTSDAQPLYRDTSIAFGPANHKGRDIIRDQVAAVAVNQSAAVAQ